MTQITDEMKVAAVKAYTDVDGKCRPAAMQKALEAALPFLPIAGEAPEGWQLVPKEPTFEQKVAGSQCWEPRPQDYDGTFGVAENTYRAMLAASPSSPGKDGGQEVEAVAAPDVAKKLELWFFRDMFESNRLALFSLFGFKAATMDTMAKQQMVFRRILSSLAASPSTHPVGKRWRVFENIFAGEWGIEEDDEDGEVILPPRRIVREHLDDIVARFNAAISTPQPASTALVERLASALLKAEEVLANYADPTAYTDGYGDPVPADAVQHEGLLAQEALDIVRSALSPFQSTSREAKP